MRRRRRHAAAPGARSGKLSLPSLDALKKNGIERGRVAAWPDALAADAEFAAARGAMMPSILWLTHPSAQNMSPYARVDTVFHTRMLDARAALREAVHAVLGIRIPEVRPDVPQHGNGRADSVYDLPEWIDAIGPRHAALARLWREKGV